MLYTISKKLSSMWAGLFRNRERFFKDLQFPISGVDSISFSGDMSSIYSENSVRVTIIGTRDIDYKAKADVWRLVHVLKKTSSETCRPLIVSGLALGVDIEAHKAALECEMPTVAVLPTGLDEIYPYAHASIAKKITETPGCGLLTQFEDKTAPIALNFLDRNKTIALMSDLVIVVASKTKGGAMLTAKLANSFGVPVYAIPGALDDERRKGCNELIRSGIAKMLPAWEDLNLAALNVK